MRAKLLSALCLFAALFAVPAVASAQGWSTPNGRHLGWCPKHMPPEYCCPPQWRWYTIRNRPYPNSYCKGDKGTLEPYDENGLMLPPTSRPGALPPSDPTSPARLSNSRGNERMRTDTIRTR